MDNDLNNQQDLFEDSGTNDKEDLPHIASTKESMAHHGIALDIFNRGVVIVGKSGIGKSELGLELIDRGHRLICDDLVAGQLAKGKVILSAPQEFGLGFMEIRGIGFIDMPRFYGKQHLCGKTELFLVIQLVDNNVLDLINHDRLLQLISSIDVLGMNIPLYKLPIGANRNLPILVELIVKYAIELEKGYDSHQIFIEQQSNFIQQGNQVPCK